MPMDKREFPAAFTQSDDYKNLTAKQVASIQSRFKYIEEIICQIEAWVSSTRSVEDVRGFLDSLELDISVNQNLPEEDKSNIYSSWLIHSSWTFCLSGALLYQQLSCDITSAIEQPLPSCRCSIQEFKTWLHGQSNALSKILEEFYSACQWESIVAHLIALDIILANMLVGLYKSRLNDFDQN